LVREHISGGKFQIHPVPLQLSSFDCGALQIAATNSTEENKHGRCKMLRDVLPCRKIGNQLCYGVDFKNRSVSQSTWRH
jgi:hypothetical protein